MGEESTVSRGGRPHLTMREENTRLHRHNRAIVEAATAAAYNMRMVLDRLNAFPLDVKRLAGFVGASVAWCDRVGGLNSVPSSVYRVLLECEDALTAYKESGEYAGDVDDLLVRLGKIARPTPKGTPRD